MFSVKSVAAGSVAKRAGICPGDILISVNGEPIQDYVDYVYFCAQTRIRFEVLRDGRRIKLRGHKEEWEDIGVEFVQPLMGKKRVCANRCIFCFVDQLPKGMRKSLYLKDEDWRYSLIMGNYVTFASIEKAELHRIIRRKASPLYISVHTVDEALRRLMLGNQNAVPIRPLLQKLTRGGIRFHAQAVICPGYNDAQQLYETYRFLRALYPAAMSLAVVPVGLTAHRAGLCTLESVTPQMARDTIKEVEKWQKECLNSIGTRFVFASDEYYIRAGYDLPPFEDYEDFAQIENGVGLISTFLGEAAEAFKKRSGMGAHISIATSEDAFAYINTLAARARDAYCAHVHIYKVKNRTFGGGVTVSGLLGGRDILRDVQGKPLGDALLIPGNALRDDNVFLDDMELSELTEALGVPVIPVLDGYEFVGQMIKEG